MKTYVKPELQVREIRVTENLAAPLSGGQLNIKSKAAWTQFNMLQALNSPAANAVALIEE